MIRGAPRGRGLLPVIWFLERRGDDGPFAQTYAEHHPARLDGAGSAGTRALAELCADATATEGFVVLTA